MCWRDQKKIVVVNGITWHIEQLDKFYNKWVIVGSWCKRIKQKVNGNDRDFILKYCHFVWWISEKPVSQHGRPSPRVLNPGLSKYEAGALPHFPAMFRNIFVFFFYSYPWWLCRTVGIRIYRYKRIACYCIWSQWLSHTTVSVTVATLRSRQRVTKEMVGGKMTRNRLGYSTTSHLASSIWVKYGVISRIVVFSKVKAEGTLKWPCG